MQRFICCEPEKKTPPFYEFASVSRGDLPAPPGHPLIDPAPVSPQRRSLARPPWLRVESVHRGVDGGARLQTWVFDEAVAARSLCIGRTARPWSKLGN